MSLADRLAAKSKGLSVMSTNAAAPRVVAPKVVVKVLV
jgi:hypothetical protein